METYRPDSDAIFQALADPTRRAVVQRLGQGDASVSELAAPFKMGLPAFLKHITILEDAGVIGTSKSGRVRTCRLQVESLAAVEEWFTRQRDTWMGRHQNLDALLTKITKESSHET
jgi:DNA-binding transcriptional ArsR family regulator